MVAPLLGTPAGRAEHGVGAGGDRTVELDRVAERVALEQLQALAEVGEGFSVLSEEVGLVDLGAPFPLVLLDPVDGSLNAKQGLPVAGVMFALLDGPTLADVRAGHVRNLISGERWTAVRGGGAARNGRPLAPLARTQEGGIELLGVESSPSSYRLAAPLLERAHKIRLLGSMAISLAHTAAGGIEVFVSPIQARLFDCSAGVLMIREVGGMVTDMAGGDISGLEAGLATRSTLLASADPLLHELALGILRATA